MVSSPWTARRITLLRRHWGVDKSASEIGDMIGVSRSAVIGKACRLGLSMPDKARRENMARAQVRRHGKRQLTSRKIAREKKHPRPRPRLVASATDGGIPLVNAGERMCRFPIGGAGKDLAVCGSPVLEIGDWRSPYCVPHHAKTHTKPEDRRRTPFVQAGTN